MSKSACKTMSGRASARKRTEQSKRRGVILRKLGGTGVSEERAFGHTQARRGDVCRKGYQKSMRKGLAVAVEAVQQGSSREAGVAGWSKEAREGGRAGSCGSCGSGRV